jgi:glycosyltransferase involved in cell wall biosynthesis
MRVLMLGWEFPPFISGGLGTACYGLTKAMSAGGTDVVFVLPRPVAAPFSTHVRLVAPKPGSVLAQPETEYRLDEFEHVSFRLVEAGPTDPYASPGDAVPTGFIETERRKVSHAESTTRMVERAVSEPTPGFIESSSPGAHYAGDLFSEVQRYASLAGEIADSESFDIIHAHDWMTYPAALALAGRSGKPLVVHVHSTEFDRSGANIDQRIYDIERRGVHAAIRVIAVSHYTRNVIERHYGVDGAKIEVVYNAIETNGNGPAANGAFDPDKYAIKKNEKIVLFLGRVTMQKGPEYFIAAARKVLEVLDDVKFIMAGSGDMIRRTIEMAAAMGIGHKVLFTGFLRGKDVDEIFKKADVYVMPSVSEPFGIAPLEAIANDVPVIISKQSGVSEVLQNVLKVDFWDTHEMANKIIAVLKHPPLRNTLREHGAMEVRKLSWADSAKACVRVYEDAIATMPA